MILKNIDESLLDAWDEWSEQSDKYESGICEEKWKSFSSNGDLGLGTLIKWAKEDGWCLSDSLYKGTTAKELREKRYPLAHVNKKVINQRYLALDKSMLPASGVLALRSAKGTGKTESIGNLAAKYQKVLYVTSRNSLNESAATRLGLVFHHDTTCLDTTNKIAITFHSLGKLSPSYLKGCLLILDEAKQGLTELTSSSTLKDRRLETKATLETLAKASQLIVLSDADLTNTELDYIAALVPDKPVTVVDNEWMPTNSNYCWVDAPDKGLINQLIFRELEQQKKLHVVSDSKDYVLALEKLVINRFPELKVKAIHGDNSDNRPFAKVRTKYEKIVQE